MSLEPGRIVRLEVADKNGHRKVRPVLILQTPANEQESFIGLAISSQVQNPKPAHHVLLRDDEETLAITKLTKTSVIVCDWYVSFQASQIKEPLGAAPDECMRNLIECLRRWKTAPDSESH